MSLYKGKAAKAADKEAEVIIASLAKASDAAIETTLCNIVEKLKSNVPLMYHINALLHNKEWTNVLEASLHHKAATEAQDAAKSSGDKPEKVWPIRAGIKKFVQLSRNVLQSEGKAWGVL